MKDIFLKSKIERVASLISGIELSGEKPYVMFAIQTPDNKGTSTFLPGVRFSRPSFSADPNGCLTLNLSSSACMNVHVGDIISGSVRMNGAVVDFEIPASYVVSVFIPGDPTSTASFEVLITLEKDLPATEQEKKKPVLKVVH